MGKMEVIERYKALKKLDKILDFFEEKYPEIMILIKNELFSEIVVQTILDFQIKEGKKNFRYFPWKQKIKEKMKQMYG